MEIRQCLKFMLFYALCIRGRWSNGRAKRRPRPVPYAYLSFKSASMLCIIVRFVVIKTCSPRLQSNYWLNPLTDTKKSWLSGRSNANLTSHPPETAFESSSETRKPLVLRGDVEIHHDIARVERNVPDRMCSFRAKLNAAEVSIAWDGSLLDVDIQQLRDVTVEGADAFGWIPGMHHLAVLVLARVQCAAGRMLASWQVIYDQQNIQ